MKHLIFLIFIVIINKSFAQLTQKKFTQKDGLSSYNIRSIVKDNNGFLWITTQDGLNKFDGNTFETFTKNKVDHRKQIDFTDCRSLYLDTVLNQLWILGAEYGIDVIDCNTGTIVKRFEIKMFNNNCFFISFYKHKNMLWIGSSQGLYLYDLITKKSKYVDISAYSKNELRINKISSDQFNNIWVGVNNYGIIVFNGTTNNVVKPITLSILGFNKNEVSFSELYFRQDLVTIGTEENTISLQYNKQYNFLKKILTPLNRNVGIRGIFKAGNILYKCENGLFKTDLIKNEEQQIKNPEIDTEDWFKSINTIAETDRNILALGCNDGLMLLNTSEQAILPTINNTATFNNNLTHVYSIEKLMDNEFIIAAEKGLFIYKNNNKLKTIDNTIAYYNILKVKDNECIVSNKKGVKIFKNKSLQNISKLYPEFKSFENYQLNKIIFYNADTSILSTENEKGLLIWNKTKHKISVINTETKGLYLKSNSLNTIIKDSKNRIWALSDYCISVLDFKAKQTQILTYQNKSSKVPLGLFFDMVEINNQQYWINCYSNGIIVLNEKFEIIKKISEENGLSNNGLYKLFAYKNLAISTGNNGISVVNINTFKTTNLYSESNNLHNNAFEEACGTIDKNIIIAGGINGYTTINLNKLSENINAPKLYFTHIITNANNKEQDTTNLNIEYLQIPNTATQTKISFVGLNYQNPTRVTYWYKIKQINNEWIALGTQNFIDLIGLKPDKYELQVKAANEDGVECTPKTITLHFLPKWYQTLFFKILVVLSIIGILALLYNFRIRQLKKIINVRKKISSDLHDDIGSTLSTINMYSQIAQLQPNDPTHAASIQENTKEVLEKLDDIVWATNPKNDQVKNLVERMDSFARPLLQAKGIQFNFTHTPKIETTILNEATRQNLFLIFKEAINNICKYAQCNTCTVNISLKNKTLFCSIADDGVGFDTTIPTERNGLLNMKQRINQLKGKINIISEEGKGTEIKLQLPI